MPPRAPRARRAKLPEGTPALIARALAEDRVGSDITTQALFPRAVRVRARVVAQSRGVVSGLAAAAELGRMTGVEVRPLVRDGSAVRARQPVLALAGDLRTILGIERTLLNLVMHLSGVATATRAAVRRSRGAGAPQVYGTRKTIPGLRALEKAAIVHGGGQPHRADLADAVLVKNNHLAFVGIPEAVERLRHRLGRRPIQVEVRTAREAVAAVKAGAEAILIDNAGPGQARAIVGAARSAPGGRRVWIELSGGITPSSIARYRRSGADAASLGSITHSAPALPFHLVVRRR